MSAVQCRELSSASCPAGCFQDAVDDQPARSRRGSNVRVDIRVDEILAGCVEGDAPRARRVLVDSFTVHTVVDDQVDWGRAFRALLMQPAMQPVKLRT